MKTIYFVLAALVIVADQITKRIANTRLAGGETFPVMPYFNFRLAYNEGAAFSFLSQAGGWQRWFFTIIAVVISVVLIVWITRLKSNERWLGIGLGLILGGAIGNLIDRVLLGHVIDFIQWFANWNGKSYFWPSFNIADAAIFCGAGIFLIYSLFTKEEETSTVD